MTTDLTETQKRNIAAREAAQSRYEQTRIAKIEGQNLVHGFISELAPLLKEWLKPFTGSQIVKADGELMKKVKDVCPKFNREGRTLSDKYFSLRWWLDISRYSVWLYADVCVSGENNVCTYQKADCYLAEIDGVTLKKVIDETPDFPTDFTVEGVAATLKQIDELKEKISALKSLIAPFGEGLNGN